MKDVQLEAGDNLNNFHQTVEDFDSDQDPELAGMSVKEREWDSLFEVRTHHDLMIAVVWRLDTVALNASWFAGPTQPQRLRR